MKKRILSLLLCFALISGAIAPVSLSADEVENIVITDVEIPEEAETEEIPEETETEEVPEEAETEEIPEEAETEEIPEETETEEIPEETETEEIPEETETEEVPEEAETEEIPEETETEEIPEEAETEEIPEEAETEEVPEEAETEEIPEEAETEEIPEEAETEEIPEELEELPDLQTIDEYDDETGISVSGVALEGASLSVSAIGDPFAVKEAPVLMQAPLKSMAPMMAAPMMLTSSAEPEEDAAEDEMLILSDMPEDEEEEEAAEEEEESEEPIIFINGADTATETVLFENWYEIKLTKDGEDVQPEGELEITFSDRDYSTFDSVTFTHYLDDADAILAGIADGTAERIDDYETVAAFPAEEEAAWEATGESGVIYVEVFSNEMGNVTLNSDGSATVVAGSCSVWNASGSSVGTSSNLDDIAPGLPNSTTSMSLFVTQNTQLTFTRRALSTYWKLSQVPSGLVATWATSKKNGTIGTDWTDGYNTAIRDCVATLSINNVAVGSTFTLTSAQASHNYQVNVNITVLDSSYTASFNANGGTVDSTSKSYNSMESLTLPTPTRDGYYFAGWKVTSATSYGNWKVGDVFNPGSTSGHVGDVTFEAQWVRYTVIFNGNGATSGSMTAQYLQPYPAAEEIALKKNEYKREFVVTFEGMGGTPASSTLTAESTFNGWEDYGSIEYNGTKYTHELFDTPSYVKSYENPGADYVYDKYTLVKDWREEHSNGFNAFTFRYGTGTSKAYYPDQALVKNLTESGGTVELVANWTDNSIKLPSAEREYCTFNGWYTAATGGTKIGNAGESYKPTANITLYAQWTVPTYKVQFNAPTATSGSMSDQSFEYGTAQNLTENAYERELVVTFNGNGGTPGSSTLTATATFNGWEDRGSIVGYDDITYAYTTFDAPYYGNANNDVFESGYANSMYDKSGLLRHWLENIVYGTENRPGVSSSGAPGLYPDGALVNNLSTTGGYTVPLYANWTDGSVTLPTATKTGYTFKGWYDAATGGNKVGDANANYTPTAAVTLYAQWDATINYEVASACAEMGSVSLATEDVDVKSATGPQGSTATPAAGYKFVGWYSDSACTTLVSSDATFKPAKDATSGEYQSATYYAKFANDSTSMTISKTGMATGDSAIFTITAEGFTPLHVVLKGGEAVTITGLEVGKTYTVTEESWSWKYTAEKSEIKVTTVATAADNVAAFTNTKKQNLSAWLNGETSKKNVFGKAQQMN